MSYIILKAQSTGQKTNTLLLGHIYRRETGNKEIQQKRKMMVLCSNECNEK